MKSKSILLIEDDYLDVESIKRVFKKWEIAHVLHVAHNGVDAINMLTKEEGRVTPDIILLDINMPKMNGIEFLKIVKSYFSLKTIKIFIITTSDEEYEKMTTQNLGVAGYIIKPLNFSNNASPDNLMLKEELMKG